MEVAINYYKLIKDLLEMVLGKLKNKASSY